MCPAAVLSPRASLRYMLNTGGPEHGSRRRTAAVWPRPPPVSFPFPTGTRSRPSRNATGQPDPDLCGAVVPVEQNDRRVRPWLRVECRKDHDWEFKPLGPVDRHDADSLFVGLRSRRFVDPRPLGRLPVDPLQKGTKGVAAGLGESAGSLHHEAVSAPLFPRPGMSIAASMSSRRRMKLSISKATDTHIRRSWKSLRTPSASMTGPSPSVHSGQGVAQIVELASGLREPSASPRRCRRRQAT